MSDTLYLKYRPTSLKEVVGQPVVVSALRSVLSKGLGHAFLFIGPSGVGKTTLARIVAAKLGAIDRDIVEVDAATNTGIDDMRRVAETLLYRPLGGGAAKVLIIDECHALSKAAWQSMLKVLEEPPTWAYWCLCTTEGAKVPETIRTRCVQFQLKPLSRDDLRDLVDHVADSEDILLGDQGAKVRDLCALSALGSPRQALVNLALCATVSDRKQAATLLASAEHSSEAIDLARALVAGHGWAQITAILETMKDQNAESVRHVVRQYMTTVLLNTTSDKAVAKGLHILDAFSQPMSPHDGISPVVLAAGRALFSQ